MIAKLLDEATAPDIVTKLNELVEAVNELIVAREDRTRAEAMDLLIRMAHVEHDLPLSLVHSSHDGEAMITLLVDRGLVDIVDTRLKVTEAGREQVDLVLRAAEDDG